jgi:hypothetical protein
MSAEIEPNTTTNERQAAERDGLLRTNDAPAPRLVLGDNGSGRLPDERAATGSPSLASVCAWVAVASAAAFAACGLWQVGAIVLQAQAVAHEVVVARTAAPSNQNPRARSGTAVGAVTVAPDAAPSARTSDAGPPRVRRGKGLDDPADPVLTVAANMTKAGARAAAFEAQAEASERAVPVGLEPALDAASSDLEVGYPPPAEYPRASCEEIFVYIVTIVEGEPKRSAASIGVGKKGRAGFRRPGERIGDWTVLAISDDWTGLNPGVWLEKDGTVCRAELEGNSSRVYPAPKPPPRPKARRRRRR